MHIPTEPIGSIPRPLSLLAAFEETGSPVVTDGEQRKYHNFWTYCVHGLRNTAPDGFRIPFAAGHTRRMPRLTSGPFRYKRYADSFLDAAQQYAKAPVRQAVISPSALSLIYPPEGLADYSREEFIEDLVRDRVLQAADYIPLSNLGTTDDCGYSPFCDDTSATRETAFAKIRARVEGTAQASRLLGL